MPVDDIALREGALTRPRPRAMAVVMRVLVIGLAPVASAVAGDGTMAADEAERAEVLQRLTRRRRAPSASAGTAPGLSERGR